MGASSSKSSSKPVNLTPSSFAALQAPFASVLAGLMGFGSAAPAGQVMTGAPGGMPSNQSGTTAPVTQQPTNRWAGMPSMSQINQRGGRVGQNEGRRPGSTRRYQNNAPQPTPQPVNWMGNGTGNPLSGIPTPNIDPLSAPMTNNEGAILNQLMAFMGNDQGGLGNAAMTLDELMAGQGPSGVGNYEPGSLEEFMASRMGAMQTPGYDAEGGNPFLNAMIEAAQRPTLEGLEETLSRTLPGRFTQAGHMVQPQGSSAFDRAAAIATRGATQSMADIATNLSFGSFEAERGRQFESQENARAQESEAMAQELERRGMFEEAERTRAFAESEAARDRQLAAAQAAPGVQKQQIDSMIANLQAQALPRLIQDMGIERGLEVFNNQVNALLSTLGITAGVTRPVIGNKSSSSSMGVSLK